MKPKQKQYRQGDVLVAAISAPSGQLTLVEPVNGQLVLAHGEATGHSHAINAAFGKLYVSDGRDTRHCYLLMETAGTLVHQEHGAIALDPGWYEVIRQREYHPAEVRHVSD